MRISRFSLSTLSAIVLSCAFSPSPEAAEGLLTLPDSAQAMAKIGARTATLDDPSVTRTNPATLTDVEGTNFQFNFQLWHGETEFTQQGTGFRDSMILPWKETGSAYLTHQLNDRLTMGLGIGLPYGVTINWPREGLFRYTTPYDAVLQTGAINPALGIRINDRLSVGVGLDIYVSRLKLDQVFSWTRAARGFPFPDGDMTFEGSGSGIGGYLGFNFDITECQRFSFVGRLPVTVDYEGDFTISRIPPPFAGAVAPSSTFNTEIEHPGSIALGYGIDLNPRTTVGFDFTWIGNDSHDDLPLQIGVNQPLLGGNDTLPLGWSESVSGGVGFSHELTEELTLLGGYLYSESPMNDRTFTPSVPANDRHIFSGGLSREVNCGQIDFAYSYIHLEDRTVQGNIMPNVNGTYDFGWHIMTLSYIRKF